jgi:hypothetical protein
MFVSARFHGRLVRWLTSTADQGRGQRDDERCSQAITLEDEFLPVFSLRIDLRADRYLLCENVKRTLSIRRLVRETTGWLTPGVERVTLVHAADSARYSDILRRVGLTEH